jgi:hypothetical protein
MHVTTVIPCANMFMEHMFQSLQFSPTSLFPLCAADSFSGHIKRLPWHHIKNRERNRSNINFISFLHDSNTDKKSVVNYDDG